MAQIYGNADRMDIIKAAQTKLYNPGQFWAFNIAKYRALLSDDPTVIKYWFKHEAGQFFPDVYQYAELTRSFYYSSEFVENAEEFFGIIPMLCDSMARMICGSGFKFDETANPKWIDRLIPILEDNNFETDILLPSVKETIGIGDPAWHIHFDPELSGLPIIELVISERQELERKSGRIVKHIIKQPVELDGEPAPYELHTIYTKRRKKYTENGVERYKDDGIRQEFKIWNGSKYVYEDRKSDLKTKIYNAYGIEKETTILPLTDFPVIYLPNNVKKGKNTSLAGMGRPFGLAFGLDSVSAALDETLSNCVDTIRKAFPFLLIDEKMIPANLKGEKDKGTFSTRRHSFVLPKNVVDADKLLQHIQAKLNTTEFVESAKFQINIALNKFGSNAATLGLQLSGHIEAEATQNAKERNSIRTRNTLVKDYECYLSKLFSGLLQYEDYINGNTIARNEKTKEEFSVVDTYDGIKVKFNEYIVDTPEEVSEVLARKVQANLISTLSVVREQHPEWEEDWVLKEANLILAEKTGGTIQVQEPGVDGGDLINIDDLNEDGKDKEEEEDPEDKTQEDERQDD